LKALYKYPQAEFPYAWLVEENRRRGRHESEFEVTDTGVFDGDRYFDVLVEYAKGSPNDIAIRLSLANRGPEPAVLHVLPTLWFRNTWSWGRDGEGYWPQPRIMGADRDGVFAEHATLGRFRMDHEAVPDARLFTDNETNTLRLFGAPSASP